MAVINVNSALLTLLPGLNRSIFFILITVYSADFHLPTVNRMSNVSQGNKYSEV